MASAVTRQEVDAVLDRIMVPGGQSLLASGMARAIAIEGDTLRFVLEAPSPEIARQMEPLRAAVEAELLRLPGLARVQIAVTAHSAAGGAAPQAGQGAGQNTGQAMGQAPGQTAGQGAAPTLKMGGHMKPQQGSMNPAGVDHILLVGSGKGGVGKSTVSSNLAVALARAGRRVGLLDADIYGPSQPRMMGATKRPASPDGKTIEPITAHGVTLMSIGLMLDASKATIWRGPMLMGALQQMMTQVNWGELDVLIIDLPPGTGDIQLTLGQKADVDGAIVVSTPQDVALLDARKAIDAFKALDVPVLGLIENMSFYTCPNCGHEAHIFGHGGVADEARGLDVPLLAQLPIDLDTRLGGDEGTPVAAGDSPMARAYGALAQQLVTMGCA